MSSKYTNESGYTLLAVLLLIMIISVFGLSLSALSLTSVTVSTKEHDYQSVYYIAEAGSNYQMEKVKKIVQNAEQHIYDQFDLLEHDENATKADYMNIINTELDKLHKQFRIHEETYSDFDPINDISPRAEVK